MAGFGGTLQLGRQNCAFSPEDVAELFPEDPCPGQKKRLMVIGVCKKSQLPLAAGRASH